MEVVEFALPFMAIKGASRFRSRVARAGSLVLCYLIPQRWQLLKLQA